MSKSKDDPILMCCTPCSRPPAARGCVKALCERCGALVWNAPATVKLLKEQGTRCSVLCEPCFVRAAERQRALTGERPAFGITRALDREVFAHTGKTASEILAEFGETVTRLDDEEPD